MFEDLPYLIAAVATVLGGIFVGRQRGVLYGFLAGLGILIVASLLLVALGFGY
ncbi:MAG: hypothetical protein FWD68_09310 [Alphaproteobacteria bacterium]|nr:hypothetical protein [Alphaproteobacteria bacterium]